MTYFRVTPLTWIILLLKHCLTIGLLFLNNQMVCYLKISKQKLLDTESTHSTEITSQAQYTNFNIQLDHSTNMAQFPLPVCIYSPSKCWVSFMAGNDYVSNYWSDYVSDYWSQLKPVSLFKVHFIGCSDFITFADLRHIRIFILLVWLDQEDFRTFSLTWGWPFIQPTRPFIQPLN